MAGLDVQKLIGISAKAGMGPLELLSAQGENPKVYRFIAAGYRSLLFAFLNEQREIVTLQFFVGFNDAASNNGVNAWNRDRRFVKAYVRDGQLSLEMDLFCIDFTAEALANYLRIWNAQLASVAQFDW
jgi:hypothetical protein